VLIESRPPSDPDLAALLTAQSREVREISAPRRDAHYLVAVVHGRVVGCVAWQALDDGAAELKRMYVRSSLRGRGIARQMIVAIEEEALAADRPVIRLETGADLPAAVALYQSSGYHQIPAYGEYIGHPGSVCFQKRLGALVHPSHHPGPRPLAD
jgi:putative acetyltransferase